MEKSKPKKQGPQKCTKKNPLFWTPIEASRGKKGKIRYVLNGFSANPTYLEFCGQKNSDFSGRMEVALSLSERVAPTPRNPYKTSAKPLLGESGRTPGTRFPFLEGKVWPDSPPRAYIYIYMCVCVLLWGKDAYSRGLRFAPSSGHAFITLSLCIHARRQTTRSKKEEDRAGRRRPI